MSYEMFRSLLNENRTKNTAQKTFFENSLLNPGPDVVVCDEGHILKNEDTSLSYAVSRIRTLRRIVLTGTPLQNNLSEYYCMVQFVKPNLLSNKKEFTNRFVNPIKNGQYFDSTKSDIQLMKRRSYVLHALLDGCVQRKDVSILIPYLPPKQEYAIYIRLSQLQNNLYKVHINTEQCSQFSYHFV